MNELRQMEIKRSKASVLAMNGEVTTSRMALISMAVSALLMGVFAAWSVIRSVSGGVSSAVAVANKIAKGDLAHPVQVQGRGEIAELLTALKDMQGALVEV
ncbi:MAG TPA: HAMP domain-containing protein, partial [Rhodoferax sp.]